MKTVKKIKKYSRGFTLVEMITTITILGIVSLIALPVISNVSDSFTIQKFESYEESLRTAAKLYVDQNQDDLFGYSDDGCTDIGFSEILSKNLIEDIELKDATCAGDSTYVRVKKNGNTYDYDVSISCKIKDKVAYEKTLPESSTCEPIGTVDDGDTPYVPMSTTIAVDPPYWETPVKSKTVSILISDEKGFGPNAKIRYYWINTSNGNAVVGGKKDYNFKNALVKSSHTLKVDVTTPSGVTGDLKLVVEPVSIMTSAGRTITEKFTSDAFRIDNTAPVVKIKASYFNNNAVGSFVKEVNNTDLVITEWKNSGYYFDFSGSTDNYGTIAKQTWKWNKTNNVNLVENYEGGTENNNGITNKTFTGHGARYGTVTLCDVANNCTSKNVKVNISTVYSIKFDGNGANSGSVNNITCYYGIDCKLPNNGFSRTGHSFDKWSVGGGEYDQGANVKNLSKDEGGTVTAKVKWKVNSYKVTYHVNDGHGYNANWHEEWVNYGADIPTYHNPQGSINEFRKFNGWNNNPGKMPANNVTLEANISDVMCMIITGHMTKPHVSSFIPKLDASGWYGSYLEYLPDNGYWRVDTPMNKNFWDTLWHFNYLWNNTGTSGYYLVYGQIYCENGSSRVRCRGWAPCQSTV